MATSIRPRPGRRLRVVALVDTLSPFGGAERLAREISMRLDRGRFEPAFCATRPSPRADAHELAAAGVETIELDRRGTADLNGWLPLISYLRRRRVDVLHAHKFGSNVWGAVIGRAARVPVVVAHEHTWSYEGEPVRRLLDRHVVARWADVLVAVSREDRRRMIEVEGIDPAVVRLIPNGIPPLPPPSGHDVRAELAIPPGAPLVGTVSVLRPQKALHVLVHAAALLATDFPEIRVVIAGRGPEEARLRSLVASLSLEERVKLLGPRRDIPDVLETLDVAVNCSDFEGTPLAVLEYMAAGKAIVATRVGGVPDLIADGADGVLVERDNPGALAAAVAALLRDPGRRRELGARARERQRRDFDIGVTVRRFEDLYEALSSAGARGPA